MEVELVLALAMFATACLGLLAGFPVALTLGGVALLFAGFGIAIGVFEPAFLRAFPLRILGAMENQILIAVPLFVLMGVILERSKVAEDLLETASLLLGRVRGGLGYAVVLVGALLAASTGIVGATVITMSLIALPTMLRQGYAPTVATGTIAAAGTLGQIIPPSIVLILLSDVMSNANQIARQEAGLPPSTISTGDLFSGALLPGLMLVGLYLLYLFFVALTRPQDCPALTKDSTADPDGLEAKTLTPTKVAFGLLAPLALILVVLGSILLGIASPTEAAAVGAIGAILLAGARLDLETGPSWRVYACLTGIPALFGVFALSAMADLRLARTDMGPIDQLGVVAAFMLIAAGLFAILGGGLTSLHRAGQLRPALRSAAEITTMVFVILIGASLFSVVFRGYGGDDVIADMLANTPGGQWGALLVIMLVMFILGFFLDFIEITFVVVPLVAPPLIMLGVDPIWLGVLMALNLQTSFLTPPFGFALFYLRGAAPPSIETIQIWKGALPFVGLQIVAIGLVATFPAIATWLPSITQ